MRVFKIFTADEWSAFVAVGEFRGSDDDIRDGFIHMSTEAQVEATLAKHFSDRTDLVIAEIAIDRVNDVLRWEPSRGGALFPHLYAPLTMSDVVDSRPVSPR